MKKILVIDDEMQLCKLMKELLEQQSYSVRIALNGNEGLKHLEGETPDLVITDLFMPEKEGFETITSIRQRYPQLKIIAISGGGKTGSVELLTLAQRMGAQMTLMKPFSRSELLLAVQEVIGLSASEKA